MLLAKPLCGFTNFPVPNSSPDSPLDVAAMLASIAGPERREPPPGDGQHRRCKQRGEWLAPDSW